MKMLQRAAALVLSAAMAVGATRRMRFLECFFRYLIKVDLPVPACP